MNTLEIKDNITIIIAEITAGDLVATTEFNFIKYESDPVDFPLHKLKKIHERIQYKLEFGDEIILSYIDEVFDFNLVFKMKKEKMDSARESLIIIKNMYSQMNGLIAEVVDLKSKLYFGLKIVNEKITFKYSREKGIYMDPVNPRFENLLKLMNFNVCPTRDLNATKKWTKVYSNLSEAMSDVNNQWYLWKGNMFYQNILMSVQSFIETFCGSLMSFHNFVTPNSTERPPYDETAILAECRILAFPPYTIISTEKTEYIKYKKENRILIGDIWKGYCAEYRINDQILLWNYGDM